MPTDLAEGAKAPAFKLPRDGGGTISLADFKGRKLVLYFYPKADTPGCTREAIDFSKLRAAITRRPARTSWGSRPIRSKPRTSSRRSTASHRLVSDESHKMLEAYGVWGKKSMYGRTFMGVTRATFLIGAGRADRPDLAQGEGRRPRRGSPGGGKVLRAERPPSIRSARCAPEFHTGFLRNVNHNWLEFAQLVRG